MNKFWIERLFDKIEKKYLKIGVFIFAIACLTHAFVLTNQLPNYDSQWFLYSSQDVVTSGRWFLKYAGGISSYFHLQWLNGLLSIIYLSTAAVVIIRCLEIDNMFLSILAGAVLVVYPTVAKTFNFMYAADAYFLAMLLASLAAWLMTMGKWRYKLLGGALLGVAVGIYQAYLSVTLVVLLLWIIRHTLIKEEAIGKDIMGMAAGGVMAACTYIAGLRYRLRGGELSSYQGISDSTLLHSPKWYFRQFIGSFFDLYKTFITDTYENKWVLAAAGFVWSITVIFLICRIVFLIKSGYIAGLLYGILALLLLPISVYSNSLLSDGVNYYSLMLEGVALVWILPLLICDEEIRNPYSNQVKRLLCNLLVLCLMINIWGYIIVDNISYLASSISYEKSYALSERIVDRIEQTEGYKDMEYVYLYGNIDVEKYEDERFHNKSVIGNGIIPYEAKTYTFFINIYLGGSYVVLNDLADSGVERINEIQESPEFQSMPGWPATGCTKLIDHVMVVKLSETE